MNPKVHNRCQESSVSTGAGPFALLGANAGMDSIGSRYALGASIPVEISGRIGSGDACADQWMFCLVHLSGSATNLVIDSVVESSSADGLVNFLAGTKDISVGLHINVAGLVSQPVAAQTSVTVTHNLGKIPAVQIIDDTGELVTATVVHDLVALNSYTVTWSYSFTGTILTIG